MKKFILLIIGLSVVVFAAYGLFIAADHPAAENFRTGMIGKAFIIVNNIKDSLALRKHPISTLELEENLKAMVAVPFASFSREEWSWFWRIMYGRFVVNPGEWPKRKRQLTRLEVEDTLINNYPQPFDAFGDEHWGIFWLHGLKGRVFKP